MRVYLLLMDHDGRRVVEDVSSFNRSDRRLSPRTETGIRASYGVPRTVAINSGIFKKKVITPEEAFNKAQEELNRSQEKGFIKNAYISKRWNPIISNGVLPMNSFMVTEEDVPLPDLEKLFAAEPIQEQYFKSDTVQEILKEINSLPYKWKGDERMSLSKFYDAITTTVRYMKNEKMFDVRKKTRKHLCNTTAIFVTRIHEFRKKLFTNLIVDEKLINENLTAELKEEFKEVIPVQPKKERMSRQESSLEIKKLEYDKRTLENLIKTSRNLPETYKIDLNEIDDDKRSKNIYQTKRLLNVLPTAISEEMKTTPDKQMVPASASEIIFRDNYLPHKTKILVSESHRNMKFAAQKKDDRERNSLTDDQIQSIYWNSDDPLENVRQGIHVDNLLKVRKLADDFSFTQPVFADEVPLPFKCEPVIKEESEEFFEQKPAELKTVRRNSRIVPADKENKTKDILFTAADFAAINDEVRIKQSKDMQFLMKKTRAMISNNEMASDRLSQIWTELGFTIKQKLDMLLKYTKDPEENNKLSEALPFWEQSLEISLTYRNAYLQYKSYLKFDALTAEFNTKLMKQYEEEYIAAEGLLLQMTSTLKSIFNDDLIIKRKKVDELLNYHHEKLDKLKEQLEC